MQLKQLIEEYADSEIMRRQGIFASIFIIQNRLQTACDKLDEEITMKQWLLLAMAGTTENPMSLTDLGRLMGCSRQNVKKIAHSLEQKGFLRLERDVYKRQVRGAMEPSWNMWTARGGCTQRNCLRGM